VLVAIFFAFRQFPRKLKQFEENYVMMTSLFGVMCAFFRSVFIIVGKSGSDSATAFSAGRYGVVGTSLVLLAGAVTTKGTFKFGPLTMLNVDIFHYVMAAANICLVHLFQGMWM
jgi:hypothetical protein